jgi:hypothetical protein
MEKFISELIYVTFYNPYNVVSYFPDNSEEKLKRN